jgi:hypothetical protein
LKGQQAGKQAGGRQREQKGGNSLSGCACQASGPFAKSCDNCSGCWRCNAFHKGPLVG